MEETSTSLVVYGDVKERLNRAIQWLENEPGEKTTMAAAKFNVSDSSIRTRLL